MIDEFGKSEHKRRRQISTIAGQNKSLSESGSGSKSNGNGTGRIRGLCRSNMFFKIINPHSIIANADHWPSFLTRFRCETIEIVAAAKLETEGPRRRIHCNTSRSPM